MLLVPHAEGTVVVAQPAHGETCAQLGRAWGNDLMGRVQPVDDVLLAAARHDDGWTVWERTPTLDAATGLPHTFATAPFTVHLAIHARWSRELATENAYAGLLVSLHHASFFARPGRIGRLRAGGRRIAAFLDELDVLCRELRLRLDASDDEVERNRRLVRTWDGISHDLLVNVLPRVRSDVPALEGARELTIARDGDHFTVEPWPFGPGVVTVATRGRLLRETFSDEGEMRQALDAAPWVELSYELRPT
ncbi:MAG: DUF3891 family protein [Thermoleophilia bacterium]|nr:DUF3891 family protein [Thermoleophilia bacterium]MDH4347061.1 DUF3891 family protein [Thermoleophilia bacterium]